MVMNPVYNGIDEAGVTHAYRDPKRWLYLFPLITTAIPFLAIWVYFAFGQTPLAALIPFLYVFAFIPGMDLLIGHDRHNPPEAVVDKMSDDTFYRVASWLLIIPHYVSFIGMTWFVGTQNLPLWAVALIVIGVGTANGGVINLAHEMGHKTDRWNRLMAKLSLGMVGYGHFTNDHNRGHHVHVATPEDHASARMGESVYAFALRELPGALIGGWQWEAKRLRNKGKPVIHWENEILQVYAFTTLVAVALVAWIGWGALPFIIAHHAFAWYGLTQVNYIEHYGLLRAKKENGRYEPCQPKHSWNTNHLFSNLLQIQLQRHSDHHAYPMRPYQALRDYEDVPQLPSGYPGCLGLAAIPPLWFKVMDPKVMKWADGDLDKVNVHPPARARLSRVWGG